MKRILSLLLALTLLSGITFTVRAEQPVLTLSSAAETEQGQSLLFTLSGGAGYISYTGYLSDNGKIKWDRTGMVYDNSKAKYRVTLTLDERGCATLPGKAQYVGAAQISLIDGYLTDAAGTTCPVDTVSTGVNVDYQRVPIYTKEGLLAIRQNLSGHYRLMSDLTFTEEDYAPGGLCYNGGDGFAPIGHCLKYSFTGSFDGNFHTVSGLRVFAAGWDYIGLFGVNAGVIKNVIVKDTVIDASIGYYTIAEPRTITGKINYADHSVWTVPTAMIDDSDLSAFDRTGFSSAKVGLICGYNRGTVENCFVSGNVTASNSAGGVVGNNAGIVNACQSNVTVTCGIAGGLVGVNNNGTIRDCRVDGTISGISVAGGLVGLSNASVQINACVNGTVSGETAAAVIGQSNSGTNTALYYKVSTGSDAKATALDDTAFAALRFDNDLWITTPDGPKLACSASCGRTAVNLFWLSYPAKTGFLEGKDLLNTDGGSLQVTYSDGTTVIVWLTDDRVSGFDNTQTGDRILTVSLEGLTTTYPITINTKIATGMTWVSKPEKLTYAKDKDQLDVTGGVVNVRYNNGTAEEKDVTALMVTGFDNTVPGKQMLTVWCEGKTVTYTITVIARLLFDINDDGAVDTLDLAQIKQYLAGLLDETVIPYADCDENGVINTGDLLILRQKLAGLM